MVKSIILMSVFAFWSICCYQCHAETLLMYFYKGKIFVEGVDRGLVKEFRLKNVFHSSETVSLAIHYEQELIFIADYSKLVRIHLVNDNGTRVLSGKGELFVNSTVKHHEELIKILDQDQCGTTLLFTRSNIRGLCVDTSSNKLYVACKTVLELNLDGSGERIAFDSHRVDLGEPTIYEGKFYFAASGWGETGIYTATLNPSKTVKASRFLASDDVTSLALIKNSSQLYYVLRDKDEIRVIDLNETNVISKLVLHWTSYNNIIRTIAVSGEYLFWTERTFYALWDRYSWRLTGGKMKNGVVTYNNTWQIESSNGRRYAVYQLVAFEHNFPPSKPGTPHTNWSRVSTTPHSHAKMLLGSWGTPVLLVSVSVILKLVN